MRFNRLLSLTINVFVVRFILGGKGLYDFDETLVCPQWFTTGLPLTDDEGLRSPDPVFRTDGWTRVLDTW